MILVTGANGQLGTQTIDFLLKKKSPTKIAGLVRSESKGADLKDKGIEIRIGDYADYDSMISALQGVNTLLLISSSTLDGRVQQHQNVIEAAKEVGVNHILYTSIVKADQKLSPLSSDHAETENLLKESGITYTIYRHTFYMEFLPLFLGNAFETGEWAFPSDGKAINLALRSEMAEVLAYGLTEADNHKNKTYEITSGTTYTLTEITHLLNEVAGRNISYRDISVTDFRNALQKIGLSEEQIAMSLMTATTFANGALEFTSDDMKELLGRKPTGLDEFIKELI
ncbi:SDR family oxidoreductase [Gracilimonas amylolytica]|uniref:SDR family oxidoreductase n=1 Tax=Gracilimonas amylolytica TaxID=1749045 RepID=UPI000CD9AE4A|nr:SDR family oxidoreductase [Gracilimonas amylolytica]